jgi:hypothetical protein
VNVDGQNYVVCHSDDCEVNDGTPSDFSGGVNRKYESDLPETETCNTQACPTYQWVVDIPDSCTEPCGGGTGEREVTCQSSEQQAVDNELCEAQPYQLMTTGCGDDLTIGNAQECTSAAILLGLVHLEGGTVALTTDSKSPSGCYFLVEARGVRFNQGGSGANGFVSEQVSICKQHGEPATKVECNKQPCEEVPLLLQLPLADVGRQRRRREDLSESEGPPLARAVGVMPMWRAGDKAAIMWAGGKYKGELKLAWALPPDDLVKHLDSKQIIPPKGCVCSAIEAAGRAWPAFCQSDAAVQRSRCHTTSSATECLARIEIPGAAGKFFTYCQPAREQALAAPELKWVVIATVSENHHSFEWKIPQEMAPVRYEMKIESSEDTSNRHYEPFSLCTSSSDPNDLSCLPCDPACSVNDGASCTGRTAFDCDVCKRYVVVRDRSRTTFIEDGTDDGRCAEECPADTLLDAGKCVDLPEPETTIPPENDDAQGDSQLDVSDGNDESDTGDVSNENDETDDPGDTSNGNGGVIVDDDADETVPTDTIRVVEGVDDDNNLNNDDDDDSAVPPDTILDHGDGVPSSNDDVDDTNPQDTAHGEVELEVGDAVDETQTTIDEEGIDETVLRSNRTVSTSKRNNTNTGATVASLVVVLLLLFLVGGYVAWQKGLLSKYVDGSHDGNVASQTTFNATFDLATVNLNDGSVGVVASSVPTNLSSASVTSSSARHYSVPGEDGDMVTVIGGIAVASVTDNSVSNGGVLKIDRGVMPSLKSAKRAAAAAVRRATKREMPASVSEQGASRCKLKGGGCTQLRAPGSPYCERHMCPSIGCTRLKSSKVKLCKSCTEAATEFGGFEDGFELHDL